MSTLKWTGERLVSSVTDENATEHIHRYAMAMQYCQGKIVVDIASGEGYGSALLAGDAASVTGIDIDPDAVKFAAGKYKRKNLEFKTGSATAIPLPDKSIDVVVSFETIEHHDKHLEMMREIKRILKPEGLLIISTPERLYYSEERNYKNPFHVKELNRQEFQLLLQEQFQNVQLLGQRLVYGSLLVNPDDEKNGFSFFDGDYQTVEKKTMKPYYYIAIASSAPLPPVRNSFFDAEKILNQRFTAIFSSPSFRLGNLMLRPAAVVMRILGLKK
jgi:SAM-dependent methyltransferase